MKRRLVALLFLAVFASGCATTYVTRERIGGRDCVVIRKEISNRPVDVDCVDNETNR